MNNASIVEKKLECEEWCDSTCNGEHKLTLKHLSTSNQYLLKIDDQELWLNNRSIHKLIEALNEIYK
jgi:hypothetical protein